MRYTMLCRKFDTLKVVLVFSSGFLFPGGLARVRSEDGTHNSVSEYHQEKLLGVHLALHEEVTNTVIDWQCTRRC